MASTLAADFTPAANRLTLPSGRPQLGNIYDDIAVAPRATSTSASRIPPRRCRYGADGALIRNLTADGELLYGVWLRGQTVVKMTLEGAIVMTIGSSSFPDELKVRNARSNQLAGC